MTQTVKNVVLIRKNRPEWQSGLFNGVGGHIEENETPLDAIIREFREETSVLIEDWRPFARLVREGNFEVVCFETTSNEIFLCKTMTDEHVMVFDITMQYDKCISNIEWLIKMALDKDNFFATVEYK